VTSSTCATNTSSPADEADAAKGHPKPSSVPLLVVLVALFDQIFFVLSAVHPCTLHVFWQFHWGKMLHQLTFIALLSVIDMARTATSIIKCSIKAFSLARE
jgi:hypothetical protein